MAYEDLEAAVAILRAGSLDVDQEDLARSDEYWYAVEETRARRGDVLVAELDAEVVGLCQVLVFAHFQHAGRNCCELESVHVRADYRNGGVGAMLLAHAERIARDARCYRMQLTSRNVRVDAHRFYLNNGFVLTSQGFKKSLSY